jgi:hypothetical protein
MRASVNRAPLKLAQSDVSEERAEADEAEED